MKILITGGAGFIGSALIRHLINHTSHTILNIDKLTYAANLNALLDVNKHERYSFKHLDICSHEEMTHVFSTFKPDSIMHLAAESHVDRSITGPSAFIQTNIVGTYTLLEVARMYWEALPISQRLSFRFHHISTDEVFGDLGHSNDLFTETTPYAPSSPYSATKAGADHLVRAWGRTYGLPVLITNCSNNYGPYQHHEKFIPSLIVKALSGQALPIYGDGAQIRDWLYVDDHVHALYQVLQHGEIGSTYNIGGHNEKKNIEVVFAICNLLEEIYPSKVSFLKAYKDLITHVQDRPGHDLRYAIDAKKIFDDIGWEPKESFESGLSKTVQWYLKHDTTSTSFTRETAT